MFADGETNEGFRIMLEKRTGCLIVLVFELFLGVMIALIPYAIWIAITVPTNANINQNYVIQTFVNIINDSDFIYINVIASVIVSFLDLMGFTNGIRFTMNAMEEITVETIILCIMSVLLLICFVKLKLTLFSFILRTVKNTISSIIINSIDASITVMAFLICNILSSIIIRTGNTVFWGLVIIFISILFIVTQKYISRNTIVGSYGYFGNISILNEICSGVINSVSATLLVFYIYLIGTNSLEINSLFEIIVWVFISYGGVFLTIHSMADDISSVLKYSSFFVSLFLFICLNAIF